MGAAMLHRRRLWARPWAWSLTGVLCSMLAGCPSEQAAAPSAQDASAEGNGQAVPKPVSKPVSKYYLGMLSIGGTVAVTLDAPEAGKVTVRFSDSPFGIDGSVVGDLLSDDDSYVVTNLGVAGADTPPAPHVVARLDDIEIGFRIAGDLLEGDIANVPGSALPSAPRLAGLMLATSLRALPATASIAGTYAFVTTRVDRMEGDLTAAHGGNKAAAGQASIMPDGRLLVCPGQNYRDDCVAPDTGAKAPGAMLRPADQTRYPGAFDLLADGEHAGRVFVARDGAEWMLFVDQQQALGDTLGLGAWVLRTARPLQEDALLGNWACRQPGVRITPLMGSQLNGAMDAHTMWIDGETIAVGMLPGVISDLQRNASFGPYSETKPAAVDGLAHVKWFDPPLLPGTELIREQVLLPLGAQRLIYLNEMRKDIDSVVWGACRRL